ncbi:16S rRNA (guanine(966)-N(2))-methyltransferase RsmD [Promicromonospora citrea]|uniref:Methyltransferase n=1 Tax=Promicromonospora citrea TaxID=43677 RepID=A0A8H9L1X0_9MICO|nr:16S rRNA (guanine(966)-N(2))-methyltransferase RsmD [Promicromonospora citrea]NNH54359.1 16S rRNA (guanine(966)-N(2))-methyltransferase RsmD [Promicromonospora citrea]GGM15823.1 methyltransferase [Promicromonospora citrea]
MSRIVAGSVGGRSIAVPAKGTRPTSDRVREAIFSRLEHLGVLDGACVLDLYAGSGALGLEAASRGATAVTLVDSARAATDVARRNVTALGLAGVRVVTATAERHAAGLGPAGLDLVFLDPPYDLGEEALAAVLEPLAAPGVLADGAVVVVERSTRTPEPSWPAGLERFARKDYGETVVYYAEPSAPPGPGPDPRSDSVGA